MSEVCRNYYVVVFQPWIVTPPHLVSVAYRYPFKLSLSPHIFPSTVLWIFLFPLFYRLFIRSRSSLKPSFFSLAPHLLSRCEALLTCTLPTPVTRHPPLLVPAPRAVCLNICRFLWRWDPPIDVLSLYPGPCNTLWGLPVTGPSTPLCPYLALPNLSSESWHHPVLGFLLGGFLCKGKRTGRLHSLAVARPDPRSPC